MLSLYFSLLLVLFFWACRCCAVVEGTGTGTGTETGTGTGTETAFTGSITDGCSECGDAAPLRWKVTLSGIQDQTCVDDPPNHCPERLNKTHILAHQQSCDWRTDNFTLCAVTANVQLELFSGTSPSAELNIPRGAQGAKYQLNGTFDCLGDNVLTFVSEDMSACRTFPETITISPD